MMTPCRGAVAKPRLILKSSEAQLQRFGDEVLSLRGNLSKVSSDLNTKKAEIAQLVCTAVLVGAS